MQRSTFFTSRMNPEPTETLDGNSLNINQERIAQLKTLFPEAFTEDQVNFKKLRELLGDVVNTSTNFYELSWAGKADARAEIQRQTTATLLPLPEASIGVETTDHVFIEGENLEVLRVLQKAYYGKVKMIYIDPPYNTGNDSFIYPDDYGENRIEYGKKAGLRKPDGTLHEFDLYKNTRENGHFHSSWLSMMYPRLFLARNLLKDDGVIFISIDDNEAANLKLLCDEVFGEENFVANVVWQRAFSPINLKKHFSESHDYILCYSKNIQQTNSFGLNRNESSTERYKNTDNDIRGVWTSTDCSVGPVVREKVYEIKSPSGRIFLPSNGRCWLYTKKRFEEMVEDNRIWFGINGDNMPRVKKFLSEVKETVTPMTLWLRDDVGDSQSASRDLKKIFDDQSFFDYPKPIGVIKRCIELTTKPNDLYTGESGFGLKMLLLD